MSEDAITKYISAGGGDGGMGGFGGGGFMPFLLGALLTGRNGILGGGRGDGEGAGACAITALETQQAFNASMTALSSNIANGFSQTALGQQAAFTGISDRVTTFGLAGMAKTDAVGDAVRTGFLGAQIAITADGASTRALITAQNEANLNRMLSDATNRAMFAELRGHSDNQASTITNTLTNSQSQGQAQAQVLANLSALNERFCAMHNEQVVTNRNVNFGSQRDSGNASGVQVR